MNENAESQSSAAAPVSLVWFRDDLRLTDNAALDQAARHGRPVIGLFVDETDTGARRLGAAARWWQQRSLGQLREALALHGVPLLFAHGDPRRIVPELAREIDCRRGLAGVHWNRRYHAPLRAVDSDIKASLTRNGFSAHSHPGYLLTEPWLVQTGSGTPYRVSHPSPPRRNRCLPTIHLAPSAFPISWEPPLILPIQL